MKRVMMGVLAAVISMPAVAIAEEQDLCLRVELASGANVSNAPAVRIGLQNGRIEILDVVSCDGTAEPAAVEVPDGGPLNVEVVEFGFTAFPNKNDDYLNWAAVLRNPNEVGWAAQMEVIIDFLDGDGGVVTTTNERVTLLPGQMVAIVDTEFDAGLAKEMLVTNSEDEWEELDFETGSVGFSGVKTKRSDGEWVTTGKATSTFSERQEDLKVVAVWKDKAGNIVGGEYAYIPFLDPDATRPFKLDTYYKLPKVVETDLYWEL